MAKLTSVACRAARGILKWSVRDLAQAAGVSPTTINLLEAERPYRVSTADKIVQAFLRHGVEITNGDGTGARLLFRYAYAYERDDSTWGVFLKWADGDPGQAVTVEKARELAAEAHRLSEPAMAQSIEAALANASERNSALRRHADGPLNRTIEALHHDESLVVAPQYAAALQSTLTSHRAFIAAETAPPLPDDEDAPGE